MFWPEYTIMVLVKNQILTFMKGLTMYDTDYENGALVCNIHRTPISKSHGRFFCLKCQHEGNGMNKTIDNVILYLVGELAKEGLIVSTDVKTAIEVLQAGVVDLEKLEGIGLLIQSV